MSSYCRNPTHQSAWKTEQYITVQGIVLGWAWVPSKYDVEYDLSSSSVSGPPAILLVFCGTGFFVGNSSQPFYKSREAMKWGTFPRNAKKKRIRIELAHQSISPLCYFRTEQISWHLPR